MSVSVTGFKRRYFRLLPSVVVVGAGLLVLKSTDLVRDAYAQASQQVAALADPLSTDPRPANADYAGGADDEIASASEVDVLNSLSKRRRELDARDSELNTRANMLTAAERRVDAKIAQLKTLQGQIAALLAQRDDAQKAQVAALVKTYSTMKPKDAARIFNSLPDAVLVPVAQQMKSDTLAMILANMTADNAKALTVKLANKLALPDTTDALNPIVQPVPGQQAQAAPAADAATGPAPVAAAAPAAATPAATAPAAGNPAAPKT
ncbi:MAG: hypothetical protein BGN82_02735 [Alphaproteobacteria bacterium 65-7]|nr:MAG: hypothetical protein BGN82_02735 [Alphaproteobacteria bacterium 65-7]